MAVSILIAFALFTLASGTKALAPIFHHTSVFTLIGLVLVGVVFTMMKPGHMLTSLHSIASNMFFYGNWGLTWYGVLFLSTAFYFARRDASDGQWMIMLLVPYLLLVYSLAYFTDAYHLGEIDSANRLMLQLMPLVILYLGSRYACVAAR